MCSFPFLRRGVRRWSLRTLVTLSLLLAVALVGGLGYVGWVRLSGSSGLDAAVKAVRAEGLPDSLAAWNKRYPAAATTQPAGPDGMTLLRGISGARPPADCETVPLIGSSVAAGQPQFGQALPVDITAVLHRFVSGQPEIYSLIDQAAQAPRFEFVHWDPAKLMDRDWVTQLTDLRRAASYAWIAALDAQARGEPDEAFEHYVKATRFETAASDEGELIMLLIRMAVQAGQAHQIEDALGRTTPSLAAVTRLHDALVRSPRPELKRCFERELAWHMELATRPELLSRLDDEFPPPTSPPLPGGSSPSTLDEISGKAKDIWTRMSRSPRGELTRALRKDLASVRTAALPWPDLAAHIAAGSGRAHSDDEMTLNVAKSMLKGQAMYRCTQAALAVEAHRLRTGHWPDKLEDAGVKLTDPFDGKPLRFLRNAEGCIVYSVGVNLTDEGGVGSATFNDHDIPFRLLDPEKRGK